MTSTARSLRGLALALFAWSMIGAEDCALTQIGKSAPGKSNPGYQPPPPLFCLMDPPVGCAAGCTGVDQMAFTSACSNVEAGPQEASFESLIIDKVNALLAQDQHVCNPSTIGVVITPCQAGITPVEWPDQDHGVCTTPPPGCPL
jgi:hypothetical protein